MAFLQREPNGNFLLRSNVGRRSSYYRNLHTKDRAVAEAALRARNAEERSRWSSTGRIKWDSMEWESLPGGTRITKQSRALAARAVEILEPQAEDLAWLLSPPRLTILAELGRLDLPEIIRMAASEVCRQRLRTPAAVRLLRRFRGASHRRPPTLAEWLWRMIQAHGGGMTWLEIANTLRAVAVDAEGRMQNAA